MPTKKLNLERLLANPPRLHEDDDGRLISNWRIDDQTVAELSKRLNVGMKTVETGAGLSTIIFGASGCRHTCIAPDAKLVERIRAYCRKAEIDDSNVNFTIAKSRDVVHQLTPGTYDLGLIDGLHGFPTAYVDFCYMTVALRVGGVLIVDDMHIHTCREIAAFMESDASWRVEILTSRFAMGIKLDETGGVDSGWGAPFVFNRSVGGKNEKGKFVELSDWYGTAYEPDLLPSPALMRTEGVETLEEWFRWGDEWSMALKLLGGMKKSSRVLEIGCGLGRIAFPLRLQLLSGTYDGFDVSSTKIDFVNRRFNSTYSNFRFQHADVQNGDYNPGGTLSAASFRFPYQHSSFDLIYAASVFTHLVPNAAQNYLHEVGRLIRPQGRVLVGAFLLDYFQRGRLRPLGCAKKFFDFHYFPNPAYPDCFAVSDPANPEALTAYKQDVLLGFAAEAGLELAEPIKPGIWSGAMDSFLLAEDLLVFRRRK